MKVVKISNRSRIQGHIKHNALYGWPDGIKWSPSPQKTRRKRRRTPLTTSVFFDAPQTGKVLLGTTVSK